MSSPNTNVLDISVRNVSRSGMRVVYIGKEAQPVTLPTIVTVNWHSWKKSSSFESLKGSIYSLLATHSVPHLISLVSGELPQDMSTVFQKAHSAAQVIVDSLRWNVDT